MSTIDTAKRTGRELVDPKLFSSVAAFAVAELGAPKQYADRIVGQAVAFLATVAQYDGPALMPSAAVDKGVHAFYLHTADAAAWFEKVAGRFIHHNPRPNAGGRGKADLGRTIEAMEKAGFAVDLKFWAETPDGLMQCDSDDGRPYGAVVGVDPDESPDDGGGSNPQPGDSDDGRDYLA